MKGEECIRKAYESILQSDYEQAIVWFEQAIALEPDHAAYHYKLSITCARSNRLIKAISHAMTAVRLEPDNRTYAFHLSHLRARELTGQAEAAMGSNGEQLYLAEALLKEAISHDPLSVEAYLLLGMTYGGLEEYAKAVQACNEVLKLDPGNETAEGLAAEYAKRWNELLNK